MRQTSAASCAVAAIAVAIGLSASGASAAEISLKSVIEIPGEPLKDFDIGFVDSAAGRYYFADRSNKSVDAFDTATHKFLFHIAGFAGSATKTSPSGPNGVLVVPGANQLWASDAPSTVRVFDISADPPKPVATINTGGKQRVDEMTYDPVNKQVIVANDSDEPAFLTFISTEGNHPILGKLALPDATDGIEQPRYNAVTGMLYQAVPIYKDQSGVGGLAVIDPAKRTLVDMILVDNCQPAGNAAGPDTFHVLGCKAGAPKSGLPAKTVVVDVKTGKVVQTFPKLGGTDEAWYDSGTEMYYLAARDNPGGPVLGVIDAATNTWVANVPTARNAHSVAADAKTGDVFVPLTPNAACPNGCVGVYGAK